MQKRLKREVHSDKLAEERREKAIEYYLSVAKEKGVKDPTVRLCVSKSITGDRVSPIIRTEHYFSGEIPYWDNKTLYQVVYAMEEFVKRDSKCVYDLKLTTIGQKFDPIENVYKYGDLTKGILDFDSEKGITLLVFLRGHYEFQKQAMEFIDQLLHKHPEWNESILKWVCVHLGSSNINLDSCGIKTGIHYSLDEDRAKNTLLLSPKTMMSTFKHVIMLKKNIIIADQTLKKKDIEKLIQSSVQETLKEETKSPLETGLKCISIDEIDDFHAKYIRPILPTLLQSTGKYEISKLYIASERNWGKVTGQLTLSIGCKKEKKEEFRKLWKIVEDAARGKIVLTCEKRRLIETQYPAKGLICCGCQNSIEDQDQFLCATCQPKCHFCFSCGFTEEEEENGKLSHPHQLVYIPKGATPDMLRRVYLSSIPAQDLGTKHIGTECDGCGTEPIVGINWSCGTCDDADVCESCFNILENPKHPKYPYIHTKLGRKGHIHEKHIYLKVDFAGSLEY